jgi:hypothetical protein
MEKERRYKTQDRFCESRMRVGSQCTRDRAMQLGLHGKENFRRVGATEIVHDVDGV